YKQAVQVEFDGLDNLLLSSVEAMSLSQHMMQARFSLDDLIVVVQASTLGSRDALSEELLKTNVEAKSIAANLQRFLHGIHSTVDLVVASNDYYIQHLHEAPAMNPFRAFICTSNDIALRSRWCATGIRISDAVSTYSYFLERFEAALLHLLQTVVDIQNSLDRLESRFSVIRDLVGLESHALSIAKEEVLGDILTLIGFNRKQLAQLNTRFAALNLVGAYRKTALHFVMGVQHGLLDMAEALGALRALTAEPMLTGKSVPMEALIEVINSGVDRLR
ncbi:hypothetical protein P692DRAFT_20646296, partial [Suillus brevipes Sb2]